MISARKVGEFFIHLLILSPLVLYQDTLYPFVVPRNAWMLTMFSGAILAILWALKAGQRIKFTKLDVAVVCFAAALVVTSFTGFDLHISLWSEEGRIMGVIFWLLWALVFVGSRALDWQPGEWRRFFYSTTIVVFLMSLLGVLQATVPSFASTSGARVVGTLGNSLIFGAYLMPHLFLLGYFMARQQAYTFPRWFVHRAVPFTILMVGSSLFFTQTRSSFLGLFIGLAVAALGFFLTQHRSETVQRARRFVLIGSACLIIGYIALFIIARQTQDNRLLRLTFSSTQSLTLKTRLINWQIALHAIGARPILGWGWENYREATNVFFNPALASYSFYETRIDKPHNALLELLVTTGALGFACYAALIILQLFALGRWQKELGGAPLAAWILIGGAVAYQVQNFFGFDTHTTVWVFGLFLLLASEHSPSLIEFELPRAWSFFRPVAFVASAVCVGAILVYGAWGPFLTGIQINHALLGLEHHDMSLVTAAWSIEEHSPAGPYPFETWRWFSHALLWNYASGADKLETIPASIWPLWEADVARMGVLTEEYAAEYPNSADWQLFTGKIAYYIAVVKDDAHFLDLADTYFQRAFVLAPERQEAPLLLSYVHALKADNAGALEWFEKAASLTVSSEVTSTVDFLSKRFVREQDYTHLVALLVFASNKTPTADLFAQLAAAYATTHHYTEARAAVARAVELDPSFEQEAEQFLKTLPKQ